jgi:cyclopropane fatty-acyl-phospholipid synthase-like methyltransferase
MSISDEKYRKFASLTFDDFRILAQDDSLSRHEKIGGPDSYLEGKKEAIFQSVLANLPLLNKKKRVVLDIGPGCGDLPKMMIDLCREKGHALLLVDSDEMLTQLPDDDFILKFSAYFPQCDALFADYVSKVDVILAYSVLHYIFVEGNVWDFFDRSLELLAEGGEMLIGDIPNISKRRRFFSSANGIKFHKAFMDTQAPPEVHFNTIERHRIDDSVVLALLNRARSQGFDAYVLPQTADLPMANRREDLLIRRP